MSTLTSLYRDINLLLDMVESRMKQFKELYNNKVKAKASVQENTEVKEIKEDVGSTEPKKKHKKKEEVIETARYVSLPSGNVLIFN
jgi:hypothetical protein